MDSSHQNSLFNALLTNAANLALMEQADETYSFLTEFIVFQRYCNSRDQMVLLSQELVALSSYLHLQMQINRVLQLCFKEPIKPQINQCVDRMCLIDHVDRIMTDVLSSAHSSVEVRLILTEERCINLHLKIDNMEPYEEAICFASDKI